MFGFHPSVILFLHKFLSDTIQSDFNQLFIMNIFSLSWYGVIFQDIVLSLKSNVQKSI